MKGTIQVVKTFGEENVPEAQAVLRFMIPRIT